MCGFGNVETIHLETRKLENEEIWNKFEFRFCPIDYD